VAKQEFQLQHLENAMKCDKKKLPTVTIKWTSTGPSNPEDEAFGHLYMIPTTSFVSQVHIRKHCLDGYCAYQAITLLDDFM
jgi:hypothetical protein